MRKSSSEHAQNAQFQIIMRMRKLLSGSLLSIHYESTPIQIYRKFHLQKLKTLIVFISLLKTLIVGTR